MLIKYNKLFGSVRIFLGVLFMIYPLYEYLRQGGRLSEESMTLLIVMFFFLMYAYSAIRNGIRELNGQLPSFDLLRFFEAAMNGFIGLYVLIISFALKIALSAKFLFLVLAGIIILNMIRDLRLISIQYVEKKRNHQSK